MTYQFAVSRIEPTQARRMTLVRTYGPIVAASICISLFVNGVIALAVALAGASA